MKYTLLILPFLAASAWGQTEDVYKNLALGDRVQVTFRSGGTITGNLARSRVGLKPGVTLDQAVDYSKEDSVTVDLSWEYPGLEGTMTILKREIREVKKLQTLDKETMERLKKQKAEVQKDLERQNAQNKADSEKREKDAQEEARKLAEKARRDKELTGKTGDVTEKLEKLKLGFELLKEFPPEAGWSAEKLKEIGGKAQRKQPVTEQENKFLQNYALWAEAKSAQDEATKGGKKEN
ncbi:MAG TPA: hypothetical protein VJB14_15060 [Planctomycetota bacterium]|nr:hypothetical protein [Planctomycetota bacterium]